MEKDSSSFRPIGKNKMIGFSFDKCIFSCLLIFSSGFFTLFSLQCPATNTGTTISSIRDVTVLTRNGSPGIPTDFDVNVQPAPDAVAVFPTQTICSGSQNAAIILTSNVPGASFLNSTTTALSVSSSFCRSLYSSRRFPRNHGRSNPDLHCR